MREDDLSEAPPSVRFPRLTPEGRTALGMREDDLSEAPPSVRFPRLTPEGRTALGMRDDDLSEAPPSVRFPRLTPEGRTALGMRDDDLSEAPPSVRFPRLTPEGRAALGMREDEALSEGPPSVRFPRLTPEGRAALGMREDEALSEGPPSVRFPRLTPEGRTALGMREDEVLSEGPPSVRFPRLTSEGRAALGMREDEALGEGPPSVRFPARLTTDLRPPIPSEIPPPDFSEPPPSVRFQRVSGEAGPGYRLKEGACAIAMLVGDRWHTPCGIVRLSPTGVWFSPADGFMPRLGTRVSAFLLSSKGSVGPLSGNVVSIEATGPSGGMLIGVQFTNIQRAVGRTILQLLQEMHALGMAELARSLSRVREQIDDPSRIRAVVRALLNAGGDGLIVGAEVPVKGMRIDLRGETARVAWECARPWGPPPYIIDMGGYNSIHRLHVASAEVDPDGRVLTPLPTRIERVRHRWFRRCKVRRKITVSYRHPLWPEVQVVGRPVLDISFAGVSFEADIENDLIFPGLEMTDIELSVDGTPVLHIHGEVRYVTPARGATPARCGLKVAPRGPNDDGPWMRLVSTQLHTTTQNGTETPESVWGLYQQSGYFNLSGKSPEHFEPLKKSFIEFGTRAAAAPRIVCQAVWPSERGIEASLSAAKVYAGSWLVHQLAKRPGKAPGVAHTRQILRDIYLRAFEYPQLDPAFAWALAFIDGDVSWSMAHVDFARPYIDQGLSAVHPFRLQEGQSADWGDPPPDQRFDIGPAAPFETAWLLDELARSHTRAYLESLDLVPERADLAETGRLWREARMARERMFFTARHAGVPIAAAIVEIGETGTNLFRLLDCVRLYVLRPGGEGAFVGLINEARMYYRSKGKASFAYIQTHQDPDHVERSKLSDLGPGNYWAISAQILPEFLEHVYELTAIGRYKSKQGKE
uniref:PilZ domain-containing protein n=1 Tax=Chondromyces catenulatus TaxID=1653841 RepID=A0A3S5GY03_9BACT|nr:hypothetical protein [Chondromyces catenulatus]